MLGVEIDTKDLSALIEESMNAVAGNTAQIALACANPHSLVVAQSDVDFKEALNHSEQTIADGVGVVLAARVSGLPIKTRIAGMDYFLALMAELSAAGNKRVLFMGSTDNVLARMTEKVEREYEGIDAVGTIAPPFGEWTDEENSSIINEINVFNPHVLWVGMTAPKQEKWVHKNRNDLNVPVMASIGAVFDFYAGTHPRAPEWMHGNGLEWLYRLLREPRRMWRRNIISTPSFFILLLRRHFLGQNQRSS